MTNIELPAAGQLVAGEWTAPTQHLDLVLEDPFRGTYLGNAAATSDADVERAIATAQAAYDDGGWLEPEEIDRCLQAAGLRTPITRVARTRDEAVEQASEMGSPVVLKVISDEALHKSDVGGVLLGLEGDEAVAGGFDRVTGVVEKSDGVVVQ